MVEDKLNLCKIKISDPGRTTNINGWELSCRPIASKSEEAGDVIQIGFHGKKHDEERKLSVTLQTDFVGFDIDRFKKELLLYAQHVKKDPILEDMIKAINEWIIAEDHINE